MFAAPRPTRSSSAAAAAPPLLLLALLFLELFLFGVEQPGFALLAAIAHLTALAVSMLLVRRPGLPSPLLAACFLAVLIVPIVQLIPLPFGGNPAWEYVGRAAIVSLDPWATRVEIVKLLGLGALFVVAMQIGRDDRWRPMFFQGLIVAAILYALWAFVDRILSPEVFLGLSRARFADRLTASFLSANTAGSLFGLFAVLALAGLSRALKRLPVDLGQRTARLGPPVTLFFVATTCLLLTASRGALLATFAALLVGLAGLVWNRSRRDQAAGAVVGIILALVGVLVVIYALSGERVTDRLGALDFSKDGRAELFAGYWRAFLNAPWLGYGLGAFHSLNSQLAPPTNPLGFAIVGSAHNVYLQWLVEVGAIGTAAMLTTIAVIVGRCAAGFMQLEPTRVYGLAALGALMVLALHGATDFALQIPAICALLTTLLGVAYGLCRRGL